MILLDELPPYFQSTKAIAIGNSDLADVTAVPFIRGGNRASRLRAHCVVTTCVDVGKGQITQVLRDFINETGRSAMTLEPVRLNSDELYHILRKRIFEELPAETQIDEVAQLYAEAIRKARQADLTSESPEEFAAACGHCLPVSSWDLRISRSLPRAVAFSRRGGLIRLMRMMAANLWSSARPTKCTCLRRTTSISTISRFALKSGRSTVH